MTRRRPTATLAKVLELIKEHSVEYVDLRFTDPRGKWQHTAQHVSTIDEDVFSDGFGFDGSSIAGWKAINEFDMILLPDASTAVLDPFAAKPSLILLCDVIEPSTGQPYTRDPRSTAKKAEAYLRASGSATPRCSAPRPNSSCSTASSSAPARTTASTRSTARKARRPA